MNKKVKIIHSDNDIIKEGSIGYLIDIFPTELYGCEVIFDEHKDNENNYLIFWFKRDDIEILEK